MRWLLDLLYGLAVLISLPIWVIPLVRSGKARGRVAAGFGRTAAPPTSGRKRVLLHAVSVGEVNAIRVLVDRLLAADDAPDVIVSVTTDTGLARAESLFADTCHIVRYPLDISWAVDRFLDSINPDAIGLVELEVWPNFVATCARRGIPVGLVNGRLTERSMKRYRLIGGLVRRSFERLAFVAAQTQAYADRFIRLGAPKARVSVTGTMKWDVARASIDRTAVDALRDAMGIDPERLLVVGGSTAPGEHELLVESVPEGTQLLCAPRRPEWFDPAAEVLVGCARRSRGDRGSETGRFLLDTIGELRLAYALADVVVVGRTFVPLHGSDMMEPVALGKPTIVGPDTTDFTETVEVLLASGALLQLEPDDLAPALRRLLVDASAREDLVEHAEAVFIDQGGASERHAELLLTLLD